MAAGLATRGLTQTAVAWLAAPPDSRGINQVHTPIEIKCRLTKGNRRTHDALSQRVELSGSMDVDRTLPIGTLLWMGRITDLPSPEVTVIEGLMQVESFNEIADVKGRHTRKSVDLSAYSETLPSTI